MDPSERLPVVAQLDDYDSPSDVIDMLGLAAFVSGAEPWARSVSLQRVRPEATLLPLGAATIRTAHAANSVATLAAGPDWTLRTRRSNDRTAELTVTAVSADVGRRVLAQASAGACEPPPPATEIVMGFWYAGHTGPRRNERAIAAAPWAQIRGNYGAAVASGIERLLMLDPTRLPGRLALLHGPPGTGKTTLLRALAHAWGSWCKVDFVLDPERLLDNPDYLMKVALTDDTDDTDGDDDGVAPDGAGSAPDGPGARWRLLVLEDCDELIRAEAKSRSGQTPGPPAEPDRRAIGSGPATCWSA